MIENNESKSDVLRVALKQKLEGFVFDVELEIPLSGVTAIYGHSGAGKTTLLRGIAGLDHNLLGSVSMGIPYGKAHPCFYQPIAVSLPMFSKKPVYLSI